MTQKKQRKPTDALKRIWARLRAWLSSSPGGQHRGKIARLLELEERTLFSATPIDLQPVSPLLLETVVNADQPAEVHASSCNPAPSVQPEQPDVTGLSANKAVVAGTRSELVIIDPRVANCEQLVQDIQKQQTAERVMQVVVLRPDQDGVHQITDLLAGCKDLDAIHVISHGSAGGVLLGSAWLDENALGAYSDELQEWRHALTSSADILFYGCNLAATDSGRAFLDEVARLTDADVVGSKDATGQTTVDGNWNLEYAPNPVETVVAPSLSFRNQWTGLLTTITVTTTADVVNGDTDSLSKLLASNGGDGVSLREAIIAANKTPGADVIVLPSGNYVLSHGELVVDDSLTIQGASAQTTTVDGNSLSRVFHTKDSSVVTMSMLTIRGGSENDNGGGVFVDNSSTLNIYDSIIRDNDGGNGRGGAFHVHGTLNLDRVLLYNNSAEHGGAIFFHGADGGSITNGTLSGNHANREGGAIWSETAIVIRSSTITGNTAQDGGGIYTKKPITITNTIIAGNSAANANDDVTGAFNSDGSNLVQVVGSGTGFGGDLTGVNPNLAALADNGGATATHALLAGSPAIDAGSSASAAADQRGYARFGPADIGAFEYNGLGPNTSPTAQTDSYLANEDSTLNVAASGVLANDVDPDGDNLQAILVSGPTHGVLSFNADGSFSYTPDAEYNGSDSFSYRASDGRATSGVVAVTLVVQAVNDPPAALDDLYSTPLNLPLTFITTGVLDNDSDVEGQTLSAALVSGPTHGVLLFNLDGSFTYVPNLLYSGTDTFTYQAFDGFNLSNVATVTINVGLFNNTPVALDDSWALTEDTALDVAPASVLMNDSDADGHTLVAQLVVAPSHGTLTLNTNGSFTYTPNADYSGTDSFSYQASDGSALSNVAVVSLTISPINDAPAAAPGSYVVDEDVSLVVAASEGVLGTATDADGDSLTAVLVAGPSNGTLILNGDGSFTYTPNANFNGVDSFTYQASDGSASSSPTTVAINVNQINDAPTALDDALTIPEDGLLVINVAGGVLGNDTDIDGDNLAVVLVTNPTNGSLVLKSDGSFTYTPNADYSGTDSFSYQASDGSALSNVAVVSLTISPVNDPPATAPGSYVMNEDVPFVVAASGGVLGTATDADGDSLTAVLVAGPSNGTLILNGDGSFTYTPNANFNGVDSFTYQASDGSASSNPTTVTINVNPINDAPTALDDALTIPEDGLLVINAAEGVLRNDTDIDGDSLAAALVSGPTHGSLVLNSDGSFTYTPNADYNGVDSFSYQINDGVALSGAATVTINISAVNDAPVTRAPDSGSTQAGQNLFFRADDGNAISLSDKDAFGSDTAEVTLTAAHGRMQLSRPDNLTFVSGSDNSAAMTIRGSLDDLNAALSRVLFTPDDGYEGSASIRITSSDLGNRGAGGALSDTKTISILVNAAPATPGPGTGGPGMNPGSGPVVILPPLGPGTGVGPGNAIGPVDDGASRPSQSTIKNHSVGSFVYATNDTTTDRAFSAATNVDSGFSFSVYNFEKRTAGQTSLVENDRKLTPLGSIHVETILRGATSRWDITERPSAEDDLTARNTSTLDVDALAAPRESGARPALAEANEFSPGDFMTTGLVATAGYLLLNPRSLAWLLALAASQSSWKSFDPLEVIYAWEDETDQENEDHPQPWWSEVGLR